MSPAQLTAGFIAADPLLPMHTTFRDCTCCADPQSLGHGEAQSAAVQLYVTQAAVALHVRLPAGITPASQPAGSVPTSHGGATPSARRHVTLRTCVEADSPHSDGQLPNSVAFQLYGSDTTQSHCGSGMNILHIARVALVQSMQVWHGHCGLPGTGMIARSSRNRGRRHVAAWRIQSRIHQGCRCSTRRCASERVQSCSESD